MQGFQLLDRFDHNSTEESPLLCPVHWYTTSTWHYCASATSANAHCVCTTTTTSSAGTLLPHSKTVPVLLLLLHQVAKYCVGTTTFDHNRHY